MKKLILTLMLLWPVVGLADFTGKDLLQLCRATATGEPNANVGKYNDCLFFLANVTVSPAWVNDENRRQVWLQYANKYPEELSWDAGTVTINAFAAAYPAEVDSGND